MTILQDPLAGLGAFVRSVEAGSFSAAARALGTTPSAVSKAVAKLEARVGVRLLQRSTRALHPTAEGLALYERGTRAIAELTTAHDELHELRGPRGPLRITAPVDLGQHWLAGKMASFLAEYPNIAVELSLTNRFVDLVEERFDVGVRLGNMGDARLMRRKIGAVRGVVCATPEYLRKHGTPRRLEDLATHRTIGYMRNGKHLPWRFADRDIELRGTFGSDNNDALLTAALANVGIAALPDYVAAADIERGRLRAVLSHLPMRGPTAYVVYAGQRHISPRIRAFIDFIACEFTKGANR